MNEWMTLGVYSFIYINELKGAWMNEWMNLIKTVTDDIDEWMHEWMNDLILNSYD